MKFSTIQLSLLLALMALTMGVMSQTLIDYRLQIDEEAVLDDTIIYDGEKCSSPGLLYCANCTAIHECNQNGESEFIWDCSAEVATNQTFCNQGACSKIPSSDCSGLGPLPFKCQDEGLFPDPGNCQKYHICIENPTKNFKPNPRTCKNGFYYNPRTGYCDKKHTVPGCPPEPPVPLCDRPGRTGPLKDNPTIYYSCKIYVVTDPPGTVLYPYLYLCPNGKKYDTASRLCK